MTDSSSSNPSGESDAPVVPRFLVTAGNTREKIDAVRDWGNIFTGNTGFEIAKALATCGEVDLLTSNATHLAAAKGLDLPHAIHASGFDSHAALDGALSALMARQTYHAIFMTAAVADYKPQRVYRVIERTATGGGGDGNLDGEETWLVRDVQAGKVKSDHPEIAVLGVRTEKIIDKFRQVWGHRGLLFKFKLEVDVVPEELVRIGQLSRVASGADFLVANSLDMVQGDDPGAFILSDGGADWIGRPRLAARLLELAWHP